MTALLHYGNQAFSVSNAAKDLLYEMVLEMAKRHDPLIHERLQEEGRLVGCYGVSGMGFELEAFLDCFGGKENFRRTVTANMDVVRALCADEHCTQYMTRLFQGIWFLLDGGRCDDPSGNHPDFEKLPLAPGDQVSPENQQQAAGDSNPDRNPIPLRNRLSEMEAAFLWLGLSMGQAIGAIGSIVGPISLLSPLWTGAPWSWGEALMGVVGTGLAVVLFFVFSRLKKGFDA